MADLTDEKNVKEKCERTQGNFKKDTDHDCIFNREIDVAEIMREIRRKVTESEKKDDFSMIGVDRVQGGLRDIHGEISRINDFAVKTRERADLNIEPGRIIPVSSSRPRIIQKIFTLIKRLVRKATRFLVLDQMSYNKKISDCVKALCESQEQVLKLAEIVASLMSEQEQFREKMHSVVLNTDEKLNQLFYRNKKQAELYERIENSIEELRKQIQEQTEQAISEQSKIIGQRIEELIRQDEIYGQQIEALSRQSDMFSAAAAKAILEYREEAGLPVERTKEQVSITQETETGNRDTYTVLDYFKFQNNFRGTRACITDRQKMYLPYFRDCQETVLDIGCGRGEFLSLMKANKISAFGIDMYPEYVVEGQLNGLDIRLGDGIEFLQNTQQTFGGIFVCQVIEHISFSQLQTLCAAAYEKLASSSYLILETPNPRCLSMYTNGFYIDPTHDRPVHPFMLQYLLSEVGFEDVRIEYTECSREQPLPHIQSDEIKNLDQVNESITRVSNMLFGSQDYAVIARKP